MKRTEQENRTMSEPSTKKHRVSYGQEPLEYLDKNKETLCFDIHNFSDLSQERGEYIQTKTMEVLGHVWSLEINPRGTKASKIDAKHVSIFLKHGGENTEQNPVNVNFRIWTKSMSSPFFKRNFTDFIALNGGLGVHDFKNREDLIREDLDENGTLTIKVDIIMGTRRCNVWFPKITPLSKDDIGPRIYSAIEKDDTADVTFCVGSSMVERKAHRMVLSVRAPALYEMSISATPMDEVGIVFRDINPITFGTILEYIYTNNLPKVNNHKNQNNDIRVIENNDEGNNNDDDDDSSNSDSSDDDNDDNDDDDHVNETNDSNNGGKISSNNSNSHAADEEESVAKSILTVANQFGCTGLKLYMESCIVEYLLVPSNAARLLLFADSYACALLKEACMNMCVDDRESVMDSNPNDWNQLKESNNLLEELFTYATLYLGGGRGIRKQYSSVVANGDGTVHDADTFDVTSVRERLEKHNLDLDGSAEMLLQRWKEHLLAL